MNLNRLRPPPGADLAAWLSSVIFDACRDCRDAGMSDREIWELLRLITDRHHPLGRTGVEADRRRAREPVEYCPACGGTTKGGHERDGSQHCWGHYDDEGPNLPGDM